MLALAGALFLVGVWACDVTGRHLGVSDHGAMVWDEIVAFLLVLALVPRELAWQAAAFVAFRFFDIVKPPPIRYFEQRFSGGFGVMFDDLVAAGYTLLVLALLKRVFREGAGGKVGRRLKRAKAHAGHRRVLHRRLGGAGGHLDRRLLGVVRARLRHLLERRQARDARRQGRTLRRHGAVSEETAREMAAGALARSRGTIALAVTGVAGPSAAAPPSRSAWCASAWARGRRVAQRDAPASRRPRSGAAAVGDPRARRGAGGCRRRIIAA